jgi:hypothetical protein
MADYGHAPYPETACGLLSGLRWTDMDQQSLLKIGRSGSGEVVTTSVTVRLTPTDSGGEQHEAQERDP